MKIEKDKVVRIDYTLVDTSGQKIDSSEGRGPLAFIQGSGQLITGLEKALEGRTTGDQFEVKIPPEEAYGERREDQQRSIAKSQLQGLDEIEVGMQLQGEDDQGNQAIFTVVSQDDDNVVLDGNHPLAGHELHFSVTIVEVREATEEELSHGQVQGPGGHEH